MRLYLYPTVFITGGIILVLELVGTRVISPFYGTTLYVWSSLITVTLVFLSLGYFLGGKLADRKPDPDGLYILIFLAGLGILLIPLMSSEILSLTNPMGPRYGALASSFVLFALPMTLLGTVAPYAIRLKVEELERVGGTAGGLYAVATVGSFIGAVLTGFYMIPNLGIDRIIYLASFTLFLVSGGWFLSRRKYRRLLVIPLLLTVLQGQYPVQEATGNAEIVYKTDSVYGQIKVVDYKDKRLMMVDGATQSCLDKRTGDSCSQYNFLFLQSLSLVSNPEDILLVGLGGGVIPEMFSGAGESIETVELDPKVVEVAQEYFDFSGKVAIDDGRHYIRNSNRKYDIIMSDAFGAYIFAPHLLTLEAFQETKEALKPGGVFVLNTIGAVEGKNSVLQKSVYTTLKEVFLHVYAVPLGPKDLDNVLFYASDIPLEIDSYPIDTEGAMILTDNYNPVEFWAIEVAEEWREGLIEFFGEDVLLG